MHTENDKIYEIKNLLKKLIADIYFIPSQYWYDELKFLSKIKEHPKNKEIDSSVLLKTNNLINAYSEKLKLGESKIDFLNTLYIRYGELLKKLENSILKSKKLQNKDEFVKAFKKYRRKLNALTGKNTELQTVYNETEQYKNIRNEINETEEDFLIQKEVNEYVNQITSDFYEDTENNSSDLLRDEISNLKNTVNKSKSDDYK